MMQLLPLLALLVASWLSLGLADSQCTGVGAPYRCCAGAAGNPANTCDWPTNLVYVSDNAVNGECTGDDQPYRCCNSPGNGDCTGNGYDGADIWKGLNICACGPDQNCATTGDNPGGCILQLPTGTFEDVHVYFGDGLALFQGAAAKGWNGRDMTSTPGWPRGLIIRGSGVNKTKLKAAVPPPVMEQSNRNSMAMFFIGQFDPPGATLAYSVPRIRFTGFECDGVSGMQPAPDIMKGFYPPLAHDLIDSYMGAMGCIQQRASGYGINAGPYHPRIIIDNVWSHDFVGTQMSIGQFGSALMEYTKQERSGCIVEVDNSNCLAGAGKNLECTGSDLPDACCGASDEQADTCRPLLCCSGNNAGTCNQFTSPSNNNWRSGWILNAAVVGELRCGYASAQPTDAYGWELEPNFSPTSGQVGKKVPHSYCVAVVGPGRSLYVNNRMHSCLKYGITSFAVGDPWYWQSGHLARIHNNVFTKTHIMNGSAWWNNWSSKNVISFTGHEGDHYNNITGFGSNIQGGRFWSIDDTIVNSEGHGYRLLGYNMIPDLRKTIVIKNATIQNISGRWINALPAAGDIGRGIEIRAALSDNVGPSNCLGGENPNAASDIHIINTSVIAPFTGKRALEINNPAANSDPDFHNCPGAKSSVTLTLGSFRNGSGDTANIGYIYSPKLNAQAVQLDGTGALTISTDSSGVCSGFVCPGGTSVVNPSGTVGTCGC